MNAGEIAIAYMPPITEDQLWDFYVRNDVCEAGHGKEIAVRPLQYRPYIVKDCEEDVYRSIGLAQNKGHLVYIRDERAYVPVGERVGAP